MNLKNVMVILVVMILLAMILGLCSNSSSNDIVGLWKSTGKEDVFYNSIEFFSDGTHITETPGWCGTYTTDENRLRISGKLYSEVFTFRLDKNELTLTNSLGYSKIYSRSE